MVLAVAIVGTAVALFPLLRERAPGVAVAYVALRTLEASVVLAGVVTILPLVARPGTQLSPGLGPEVSAGLHLVHDWTFLVGPGLIVPFHTAALAWALWRHRLAPRAIPILGLIGAPVVGLANLGVLFGLFTPQPLAAVPVFAWEISLALWLILRGPEGGPDAKRANSAAQMTVSGAH